MLLFPPGFTAEQKHKALQLVADYGTRKAAGFTQLLAQQKAEIAHMEVTFDYSVFAGAKGPLSGPDSVPLTLLNNNRLTHWLAVDINSQVLAGGLTEEACTAAAQCVPGALDWTVEGATAAAYYCWRSGGPMSDLDFLDGVYLRT